MNRKSSFPFLTDFYICHFTTTVLLLCPFISKSSGKLGFLCWIVVVLKVETQCIKMPKIASFAFMQKWNSTQIEITEFLIEPYFPQKPNQ